MGERGRGLSGVRRERVVRERRCLGSVRGVQSAGARKGGGLGKVREVQSMQVRERRQKRGSEVETAREWDERGSKGPRQCGKGRGGVRAVSKGPRW